VIVYKRYLEKGMSVHQIPHDERDRHDRRNIETTIALMVKGVAKKNIFFGAKLKFIGIIWAKIRKACTTQNSKKIIFRRSIK